MSYVSVAQPEADECPIRTPMDLSDNPESPFESPVVRMPNKRQRKGRPVMKKVISRLGKGMK
jgi:hypothetical protein